MKALSTILNQRITLYQLQETSNEFGTIKSSLLPLRTVWAKVTNLPNKLLEDFGKQDPVKIYKIIIRLSKKIDIGCYFKYEDKLIKITSILHDDNDNFITEITGEEEINT